MTPGTPVGARTFRAAEGLKVRSWGESCDVAYVASTRNTHLLDAGASTVLQALIASGAGSAHEVWRQLPADTGAQDLPDADALGALEAQLDALVTAGMARESTHLGNTGRT